MSHLAHVFRKDVEHAERFEQTTGEDQKLEQRRFGENVKHEPAEDPVQGAGLGDIHALSHEVSEWYDDPFVNNLVQPWEDLEFAPQYGCTAYLETGDPVVGIWFPLAGNPQPGANGKYHPEDEVHFSFFARQTP